MPRPISTFASLALIALVASFALPANAVSVSADGDAGVYGFQQRESRVERVPHGRALHAGWDRSATVPSHGLFFQFGDPYGYGLGTDRRGLRRRALPAPHVPAPGRVLPPAYAPRP